MAIIPGKSLKVLDSHGIGFSRWKASWKIGKLDKSPQFFDSGHPVLGEGDLIVTGGKEIQVDFCHL